MSKDQRVPARARLAGRRLRTSARAVLCITTSLGLVAGVGATASASARRAARKTSSTTLTLFSAAGLQPFEQALANAFEKSNPNVKVTLDVEADTNFNTVLPRLLASSSPPDISQPESGFIQLVGDGLLANLDKYAQKYGWTKKIPASALAPGRVAHGVVGSGPLYSAGGMAGPMVGVYYNKALAAKVGMKTVPTSVSALASVLATAKADGITPIIASNEDGLVGHLYSLLLGDYMGAKALNAVIYHQKGAKLDTRAAVAATTELAKWVKAGYFNSDANAIQQETSYGEFSQGKGLFMFQGSWMLQSLPKSFAGKYGVFPFPPLKAGGAYTAMTGNSLAFSISAHSKDQRAAAEFLNFLTTPAAAKIAVANGYAALSGAKPKPASLSGTINAQIQNGYALIAKDDGFTSWLQNAAPQVSTAETQQLQTLLAGRTTPAAMVKALQSVYTASLPTR